MNRPRCLIYGALGPGHIGRGRRLWIFSEGRQAGSLGIPGRHEEKTGRRAYQGVHALRC